MFTDPSAADIFDSDMATVYRVEQRNRTKLSEFRLEILCFGVGLSV